MKETTTGAIMILSPDKSAATGRKIMWNGSSPRMTILGSSMG